jgi:hypothetical protein
MALLQEPITLLSQRRLDSFFVDPSRGVVRTINESLDVNLREEIPPHDAVPSFDEIEDRLLRYAQALGVSTNEMERKEDGSLWARKADGKRLMHSKTLGPDKPIEFIHDRSVEVRRSAAGFPFLDNDDKVELKLGVNGRLLKFAMDWRILEPGRTNRVVSINEIIDCIKQGRALADTGNEYPAGDISQIVLKDFRIFYYAPRPKPMGAHLLQPIGTNVDIYPVASFHGVFKSKSGKTDGGLYVPLTEAH